MCIRALWNVTNVYNNSLNFSNILYYILCISYEWSIVYLLVFLFFFQIIKQNSVLKFFDFGPLLQGCVTCSLGILNSVYYNIYIVGNVTNVLSTRNSGAKVSSLLLHLLHINRRRPPSREPFHRHIYTCGTRRRDARGENLNSNNQRNYMPPPPSITLFALPTNVTHKYALYTSPN